MTGRGEHRCASPADFEALVAYWLGELPADVEAPLEEHLFGCAHCTARLEELAALASGVRAVMRDGHVTLVVPAPFLAAMKQSGLRVREYRLGPGSSVNCTILPDDDAVVSRVTAPLAGVRRLDAVQWVQVGDAEGPATRVEDIPFDPATGEVVFIPAAAWLKTLPAATVRKRLIAVGDAGERVVGEYTFLHSPQSP